MSPDPAPTLSIPVLVVGAGPTGLIAALNLAQHGIECVLVDRNESVGEWPKMDLTNSRSMELLRRMGLADEIRVQGMFLRCFLFLCFLFLVGQCQDWDEGFSLKIYWYVVRGGTTSFVGCFVQRWVWGE
jgi:hypothetical protein